MSSDNTLLIVSVVAVVVAAFALAFTVINMSVLQNVMLSAVDDSGFAYVEIAEDVNIIITNPNPAELDWGAGAVDVGSAVQNPANPVVGVTGAVLDTLAEGAEDAWTGGQVNTPFTIENIGNVDVILYVKAEKDIDEFLTGGAVLSFGSEQYYSIYPAGPTACPNGVPTNRCPTGDCVWGQGTNGGLNWNVFFASALPADDGHILCDDFQDGNTGEADEVYLDVFIFLDKNVPPTGPSGSGLANNRAENTIVVGADISLTP
jgi:hypothetical protein